MKLYYFKDKLGNFGDEINSWLWKLLIPDALKENDAIFCGIGTILNQDIPKDPAKKIVFGSGVGYGRLPDDISSQNWNFISVRGPLSAKILKLRENTAVTDGAILIASLPGFEVIPESDREGVVFMPHHENALKYGQWQKICKKAGIIFLDPRDDLILLTQAIRRAKLVLAEAMHAAIVADAMRVPWIPIVVSANVNNFKWLDWTSSLKLPYIPEGLPASTLWEAWKNIKIKLAGDSLLFNPLTADEALRFIANQHHILANDRWTSKKVRTEFIDRQLSKVRNLFGVKAFISFVDPLFARRARKKLISVSHNSRHFLSSDVIFKEKLTEMLNRLDILKTISSAEYAENDVSLSGKSRESNG